MLENRKLLAFLLILVPLLVLGLLIYLWNSVAKPPGEEVAKEEAAPTTFPVAPTIREEPKGAGFLQNILDQFREGLGSLGERVQEIGLPRPVAPPTPITSLMTPHERAIEELRRKIASGEVKINRPTPTKYTKEEIFRLQYPQYFLDYLSDMQETMVEEGYVKPEERIVFKAHEDVLNFVRREINFLADSGALIFKSKEDRDKYIDNVLANLLLLNVMEADLLEKGALVPSQ